ncbi:MAG: hypothetical protein ACRD3D_13185 [Terriglobia bacterium]
MAKRHKSRRRNRNGLFGSSRRRSNPTLARRHHRRHRNPMELPLPIREWPATVGGAVAGGIAASWVTNKVLGASDTGFMGYAGNAAVAVLGSAALSKWKSVSLGWLLGGLTMTFGRIFDDYFGSQVVQFQAPASMGSYYRNTNYALPAPVGNDLTNSVAALPPVAALPSGTVAAGNATLAKQKLAGLGWNPRFTSSRFAA